ncbi:MAG: UbiD family decarboxylase [Thermodesulfobacteriota bacterium]|nr:UbiD family decarboxylase [Thermodesulfobacteriota bacterium]
MIFKDLRGYTDKLKDEGELLQIEEEVDWNLEVGAIIRRSYDLKAPAPFFQKIKDYPDGYRIFGAPAGASNKPDRYYVRSAISLGLKPDSTASEIIEEYIKRKNQPIKPVLVKGGACKENILIGEELDLEAFPAPLLHQGDGGRYIGTWHIVVTKDPDTGWVNWGMYRLMLHDKKSMGILLTPLQDIGSMYYQKYESRDKPMEVAIAMGTEPVTSLIACSMLPVGVNEADIVGGIRGEPIELAKGETVDLDVPANAEIIIEGEILPYERKDEGPFGEYTGFRAGKRSPKPVIHVKAITHRNDPILPVSCMGVPVDDSHACMTLTMAGDILDELRKQGLPVKMVYLPPDSACHMVVVSTRVPYPNFAKRVATGVWATKAGNLSYYLIVVDDDVEVTNMNEVLHAMCNKCHPDRGIFKMPNSPGSPVLIPFLNPQERLIGNAARVLFDCTWPKDWPDEDTPSKVSFNVAWPKEIQERVLSKWGKYGY